MKFSMTDKKQRRKLELQDIVIVIETDTSPDLSFLGEYSNTPAKVHIDREERGDRGHGEYRYFNMSHNYEGENNRDQKKYMEQDYKRYEDYNRGNWCMVGIKAYALVTRKVHGAAQRHEFDSGGLWGIESDSEKSYFQEVADEQLADLRQILADFHVPLDKFEELSINAKSNIKHE